MTEYFYDVCFFACYHLMFYQNGDCNQSKSNPRLVRECYLMHCLNIEK